MEDFSKAYARIQKATGCTAQTELAQRLGIRQCFISDIVSVDNSGVREAAQEA